MGKVQFDPMFDNVRKRVGNYVHVKWKGMHIIRKYNPDRPPSTPAQIEIHNAFKICVSVWNHLPEKIKKSWKPLTAGRPVTEYNVFIGENSMKQRNGVPYLITPGSGLDNLTGYAVVSAAAGQIEINFDPVTVPVNLTVILHKADAGKGTNEVVIKADVYSGTRPVVITGLANGTEYFVYCIVTDHPYAAMTKMSISAGFKVTIA